MAAKRYKAEKIVTKLRQVDMLNAQSKSMVGGDPPKSRASTCVENGAYWQWKVSDAYTPSTTSFHSENFNSHHYPS